MPTLESHTTKRQCPSQPEGDRHIRERKRGEGYQINADINCMRIEQLCKAGGRHREPIFRPDKAQIWPLIGYVLNIGIWARKAIGMLSCIFSKPDLGPWSSP